MKKKLFLPVLVLILFAAGCCAPARAQGEPSGDKRISAIRVKGNFSVSTSTILNRLKMKPGDVFEETALNKELKRLYATGYFSDVFVETEDLPEGMVVTFTVVEKPVISDIEFRGNTRLKSSFLAKKLSIKKGDLLDFNLLAQDVAEIKTSYIEEGYSRAGVDYSVETDPRTGKATVVFTIDEGLPVKIRSIKIEGNESIPDKEIQKYMATRTAWWFIRKGAFDDEKFEADLDRVRAVYRSRGFLDARVTSKADYSPDGRSMYLTVIVDEGKKYLVGDIDIRGELAFPEKEVRRILKIRSGDPFDYRKIKEDVENVRAFYYNRGYMNAEVDLRHRYNAATDKMDLIFDINAHDEVAVGRINVIGNTKTRDKVVRRELRVYPGERYDGEKLRRSKQRIYDLGFFEDVYFETVPTDEKDVKDLNVTVKETKTGDLSFGGGYSSVDAFIGFAQIKQRNFDILNFPTFTGGGQDLTVRGEMGSAKTDYYVSWTDPWIFDYPLLFGFDFYRQEHKKFGTSGYDYAERRMGGDLRLGKEITDNLSAGATYNLEEVKISDLPDDATQDLQDEAGVNWVSRLSGNVKYDTRDNRYSPTKGWVGGISVENAGGFIGGDKDFIKTYLHASYYHSILDKLVLELKGRGGIVESYADTDKVPVYERFFAGGATTLRGYKQRSVGPRDDAGHYIGGNAMLLGNIEVTFPIFERLIKGAVFYDVGSVTKKTGDLFDFDEYKMDAGVGVRVKTPIGPVKLDYGYPLSDNHDDKKEGQFWFSVSHGF